MKESPFDILTQNEQEIRISKALKITSRKTPIGRLKNQLISKIEEFKKDYDLLPEERKEKNKHTQIVVIGFLEKICLALEEFYIEDEKEFVKNVFKDGKDESNKNLKPHLYYEYLISK